MERWIASFLVLTMLFAFTACQKREVFEETQPGQLQATETEEPSVPTVVQTRPTETETQPSEPATLPPELGDDAFARVLDYIPSAEQELIYATENNFTGQRIYEFVEVYLRYGTVKKLMMVSEELAQQGLYLKIWDGFRPVSAQFKLWEICPDSTYVANPNKGYSNHSRGNAVDLTLVDENGNELEMPTGFDDFSGRADRDYSECTETAAANARLLEDTMQKHGFKGYYGEWWHFNDTDAYPVEEVFQPNFG